MLPPVSLLDANQAQYWFLSGYTSKTPGTEDGIAEPTPTFSCVSLALLETTYLRRATC